jgi:adenine-specific DNA glycosylase
MAPRISRASGVGRYTADALAANAFGCPVLPVDVNVRRVLDRTGHDFDHECGQALMELGARICIARVPRCGDCPLAERCPSRGKRFAPARRQGSYEGSFRQQRARALRLISAKPRAVTDLARKTVTALERDRSSGWTAKSCGSQRVKPNTSSGTQCGVTTVLVVDDEDCAWGRSLPSVPVLPHRRQRTATQLAECSSASLRISSFSTSCCQ